MVRKCLLESFTAAMNEKSVDHLVEWFKTKGSMMSKIYRPGLIKKIQPSGIPRSSFESYFCY